MKKIIFALCCLLAGQAQAGEWWSWNAAVQTTALSNQGSQLRKGAGEVGLLLSGDYLEARGFTLAYTATAVQMLQGQADINQRALFISMREHFYNDWLAGRFTLRADGHRVSNDDGTGLSDDVRAGALQLGYTDHARQYYFDAGFARSNYRDLLYIDQFTPSMGLALQDGYAWLQLRSYLIRFSDAALAQGYRQTRALETKYTYWFEPGSRFKPDHIQLAHLYGQRLFAVDMDAGSLGNLSDLQTGGLALGLEWKVGRDNKLLLLGGQNRYENVSLSNQYKGNFLYLNWNSGW